nr:small heat shock protein [Magelona pitelkai]
MSQIQKSLSQQTSSSKTVSSSKSVTVKKTSMVSKTSSKSVTVKKTGKSFNDAALDFMPKFAITSGIEDDFEVRVKKMREEMLQLMPSTSTSLLKLDAPSLKELVGKDGKAHLNFDVSQFNSETVHVKTEGNKMEVHAKKVSRDGDDEQTQEFSRTYELPEGVKSDMVESSFFKDGVLTVALPLAAIEAAK